MYYTEACLNLNFEAVHKLMFNETVRLEVFAALSNWLNTNTSQGSFISLTSLTALIQRIFSGHVQPVSSQYCCFLYVSPRPAKICLSSPKIPTAEDPNGLIV